MSRARAAFLSLLAAKQHFYSAFKHPALQRASVRAATLTTLTSLGMAYNYLDDDKVEKAKLTAMVYLNLAADMARLHTSMGEYFDQKSAKQLLENEFAEFQPNDLLLYRGEYFLSEDPLEQERQIENLLTTGRFPALFKLRPGATGKMFNPPATVGDPVVNGDNPELPDGWSDNLVSFTADFEHAKNYTNQDGYVIVAKPDKAICMADHITGSPSNPKGDQVNEYEYACNKATPDNIAFVLIYHDGKVSDVRVNESFFKEGAKFIADAELNKAISEMASLLNPPAALASALPSLKAAIKPECQKSAFEKKVSSNIFKHFEKVIGRRISKLGTTSLTDRPLPDVRTVIATRGLSEHLLYPDDLKELQDYAGVHLSEPEIRNLGLLPPATASAQLMTPMRSDSEVADILLSTPHTPAEDRCSSTALSIRETEAPPPRSGRLSWQRKRTTPLSAFAPITSETPGTVGTPSTPDTPIRSLSRAYLNDMDDTLSDSTRIQLSFEEPDDTTSSFRP